MNLVDLLQRWVNINSYSYHSIGLEKMIQLAQESFAILKPEATQILPSGLFLKKRKEAPLQIFLGGHLDTVFPPDHPFQKAIQLDNNRLQGPGAADMKGGVLVMLHALKQFEDSPFAKNLGWEIFLNVDEEIGSPHSTPFLRECSTRCDCALFFEPTLPDGSFASSRGGSSNYLVTSKGKAAHAGRNPEEGKNAIYPLCQFIRSIEPLQNHDTSINVGTIKGGIAPNIVPDHAEALFNIRFHTDIESILKEKADIAGVQLQRTSYRPPKPFDHKTKKLFELLKSCGEKLGLSVKWRKTKGVCDGNTFGAAGIPTIDTLGVDGGEIHTKNEFVYLSSVTEKAKLTLYLLEELARRKSI